MPVRARVGDDRVRRAGPPLPSPRPVLNQPTEWLTIVIAVRLRVLLGLREADLGVDADQVELRARRHLVDDLGDRRAVLLGRAPGAPPQKSTVVDACRQVARLPGGSCSPAKPRSMIATFTPAPVAPAACQASRRRGGDALALGAERDRVQRRADPGDAARAESRRTAARNERLDQIAGCGSTVPPAAAMAAWASAPTVSTTTRTRWFTVSSPLHLAVGSACVDMQRRSSRGASRAVNSDDRIGRASESPGALDCAAGALAAGVTENMTSGPRITSHAAGRLEVAC